MKYNNQVIREFPGHIAGDRDIYENLSEYLNSNGLRNIVDTQGNGRNWYVLAQVPKNELEMIVSFDESGVLNKRTKMIGEISTRYDDEESQIVASKLCQVLSGYIPSTPKEDKE